MRSLSVQGKINRLLGFKIDSGYLEGDEQLHMNIGTLMRAKTLARFTTETLMKMMLGCRMMGSIGRYMKKPQVYHMRQSGLPLILTIVFG
jgi:hypothetical protein